MNIFLKDDLFKVAQQPSRHIQGRVKFSPTSPYEVETPTIVEEKAVPTGNRLINFTVERAGEDKFFGFGVMTKAQVKYYVAPQDREFQEQNDKFLMPMLYSKNKESYWIPWLHITDTRRDEITNIYSYTAYDNIEYANHLTLEEAGIVIPEHFTPVQLADLLKPHIHVKECIFLTDKVSNERVFKNNYDGKETIRTLLNEIAEITYSVYYIDRDGRLVFKRLMKDGIPNYNITPDNTLDIEYHDNRRLQTIAKTTELGDNVEASTTLIGSTQHIRNNSLLELRDDIADILNHGISLMGDMTIADATINWRGNPAIEVGDKIVFTFRGKPNITTYLLNDSITFDGALSQKTQWEFKDEEEHTDSVSLGDKLNDTFAVVDKANKRIDMAVKDIDTNKSEISAIKMNQNSINASVEKLEKNVNVGFEGVNKDIADVLKKVEATMTPEEIELQIKKEIGKGVDKVTTSTGFTFDENGLTVDKSGSEMSTIITENGMTIKRDNTDVLVANNQGVEAYNLHAKTYLIIGNTSRFEDYRNPKGELRTGCFWIGG